MNERNRLPFDDEIDLREIALTLWKGRWLIIILTLAAALVAFAVSAWLLPKQYEAVAYVSVRQPKVIYDTGQEGLSFAATAPDIKALPTLLNSGIILEQVVEDERVAPLIVSDGKALDKEALDKMVEVSIVGASQLRFHVTDTDPQRAAILATVWAEKAAEWIEVNYGIGALAATLDAQAAQAQQDYAEAQSALETFLAEDITPILTNQRQVQDSLYTCLDRRASAVNAILQRLKDLEARLKQSEDALSLSDAVLLASIQQDSDSLETCGGSATILQSSSPTLFNGISSSHGLEVIAGLRQSLQKRNVNAQTEQEFMQKEILKLRVEIEQLDYQRTEYTRRRNQVQSIYTQLSFQQVVIKSLLQQSGRVADVSVEAITPESESASSPKPLMNSAVAGMLGLILGVTGVLGVEWWKKQGAESNNKA